MSDNSNDNYRDIFLKTSDADLTAPKLTPALYSPNYVGGNPPAPIIPSVVQTKDQSRLPSEKIPVVKTEEDQFGLIPYRNGGTPVVDRDSRSKQEAVIRAITIKNDAGYYYRYTNPDGTPGFVDSSGAIVPRKN